MSEELSDPVGGFSVAVSGSARGTELVMLSFRRLMAGLLIDVVNVEWNEPGVSILESERWSTE